VIGPNAAQERADRIFAARRQALTEAVATSPEHHITVTGGGPFGRAYFECSCGIARTYASKHDANRGALRHHHEVTGCTCPGLAETHHEQMRKSA
jgi:hypothetical protein